MKILQNRVSFLANANCACQRQKESFQHSFVELKKSFNLMQVGIRFCQEAYEVKLDYEMPMRSLLDYNVRTGIDDFVF